MQKVLFFLSIFVLIFSLQACNKSPNIDGEWKFNTEYTVKSAEDPQSIESQFMGIFASLTMKVDTSKKIYSVSMRNMNKEFPLEIISEKDGVYTLKTDGKETEWKLEKDEKGEDVLIIHDNNTQKNLAFSRVKK